MPTVNKVKRPWIKEKPKEPNQGRKNPNRDVYGSQRWRRTSELYRQAHPLCADCKEHGTLRPSKVVDHVKPINQGGDAWDESNYMALCVSCHNAKSRTERDGYVKPNEIDD